jgi:hypothetical protein
MSEMSFEDIIRQFNKDEAAKERANGEANIPSPKDYTSTIYMNDGTYYEHPGVMAVDIGARILVIEGFDKMTSYNADRVAFYEVELTSTLETDSE